MITCNLMGGLGNQLFQIFTVIAYSIETKQKFIFPEKLPDWDKRHTYWNNLLINLQKYILVSKIFKWNQHNETNFHYDNIPLSNDNLILNGYFQSYKYFDNQWGQICNIVGINELVNKIKDKYSNYLNNCTVSIHFRHGDYVNKQDHHPILGYEYYEKSIDLIINKIGINNFDVHYFCEENDIYAVNSIISNLQNKFPEIKFIKIDFTISDWEQMLLMSLCNHNIIANSTFSWWGAYIGYKLNVNKIVCYPSTWFGHALSHYNLNDLFLDKWNKI